jgi:hypothetical protein
MAVNFAKLPELLRRKADSPWSVLYRPFRGRWCVSSAVSSPLHGIRAPGAWRRGRRSSSTRRGSRILAIHNSVSWVGC